MRDSVYIIQTPLSKHKLAFIIVNFRPLTTRCIIMINPLLVSQNSKKKPPHQVAYANRSGVTIRAFGEVWLIARKSRLVNVRRA